MSDTPLFLDDDEQALAHALWAQALTVQQRAHAPYSRFQVGAALVDETGRIHAGCNVENAAYPEGVCAEAGAISAMVAAGGQHIRGLLVVGSGAQWVTPCGGCRQKIREFAAPHTPVWVANTQTVQARLTLQTLLPHSFGPDHLTDSLKADAP
ncbi:cytidine deaminase family protein [Hydrogenophaga soli]